jgi:pimeloyl-ACP methyl ester carboxylesterase
MKLFYRMYGDGPVLVILHGLYGSSDNWVSIARKISVKYTVILPDLRNHGQSPHSSVHNYDIMTEDILELIRNLGIRRFILAGHSMGGKVAMKFASKWPEMIEALVVADISPFGSADPENRFYREHKEILEAILSLNPGEFNSRDDVEESLAGKIESERIRGFLMKNITRRTDGRLEWKLNADALLSNLGNITGSIFSDDNMPDRLTGFQVLFIKGGDSGYLKSSDFNNITRVFPAAELITIENAGHWIHADRHGEIEKILLSLT